MSNNVETEYLELNKKNEWSALYQRIRAESAKNGSECTEAAKPQNKILNRYRDVSPYDHSRVILHRGTTDYINANLIKVAKANRTYILTQGPLANTVSHFWLMVWEQNTMAVLMLNKLIEKKQEKCHQYWPQKIGLEHLLRMDDVQLTLEYIQQEDHSYYLTRLLRLTDLESGQSRDVIQFHYTTWPDFGVPSSPTVFLEFLRKVRNAGVLEDTVGPAIVHCSAGIGRSGTFCLVDSSLVLIEKFGLNEVDVKEILFEMRNYRMGLIQTPEQLRFSYQAIIEGAKHSLNPNHSNNSLENHVFTNNDGGLSDGSTCSNDDDDPPPLPPPRLDSLKNRPQNGSLLLDRPLPNIPNSVSLNDFNYDDDNCSIEESYIPSGPLPIVPADEEQSSADEANEKSDNSTLLSSDDSSVKSKEELSELRHRKRQEQKERLEAQVRDMKRRQQVNEKWTQLKRPKTSSLQD